MNTKLSLREKAAFGCGDFASSMFWKLFTIFLIFFYTDIFGLTAAAVGTMILVVRTCDALFDPVVGMICDRTRSRWGRFRPYLLFVAVPFALAGMLTFTTPDLSPSGKLIYAYVTYALMMAVYSMINVPYAALMGVMTDDSKEKTSLASWRFIGAFSGSLFVVATANYLVEYFGDGNDISAAGYQWTVMAYAVLAAFFFFLTFAGTRERLQPPREEKSSLKEDLLDLAKNFQWFIMLGAAICVLIFNTLRDGSILYYFKYYIQDQTVAIFGREYALSYGELSAAYATIWVGTNIIGVLLAQPVAMRIGKKNTFLVSTILSAALSFALFFIQPHQLGWLFFSNVLIGIAAGVVMPLIWAIYADIADYSEWKTGRRATGLIFSSSSMSQKLGGTVAGALVAWILAMFGFVANMEQTEESLFGIRLMISVFAGVGALLAAAFIFFYRLDETTMAQIETDLQKTRKK